MEGIEIEERQVPLESQSDSEVEWIEIGGRAILHPARRHNCLAWTDGDYLVAGISENVMVLRPNAMLNAVNAHIRDIDDDVRILRDRAKLDADLGRRLRLKDSVRGSEIVVSLGKVGLSEGDWKGVDGCGGWVVSVGGKGGGELCGWKESDTEKWGGLKGGWCKAWSVGKELKVLAGQCVIVNDEVFVAVGGRKGLGIWKVEKYQLQSTVEPSLVNLVDDRWASSVAWIVHPQSKCLFLAVGRLDSTVEVYEVTQNEDVLAKEKYSLKFVWGDSRNLPLSVSVLAWEARKDEIVLATGSGNSVFCYSFMQSDETSSFAHVARLSCPSAHHRLVSGLAFSADSQLISAAQDGTVILWKMLRESSTLQQVMYIREQNFSRPIFGLVMSPTRRLMALMISVLERSGPITASSGEGSTLNKFTSSQRRCILSILAPFKSRATCESVVDDAIQRLKQGVVASPLALWDLEWVLRLSYSHEKSNVLDVLLERGKRLTSSDSPTSYDWMLAYRLLRMRANIGEDDEDFDEDYRMLRKCRDFRLKTHAFESLQNFSHRPKPLNKSSYSEKELLILSHILHIASTDNAETTLPAVSEVQSSVISVVREMLSTYELSESLCYGSCTICGPSSKLLKHDKCGQITFSCKESHEFPMCVLSMLPILEAVPLICQGCGAYASFEAQRNKELVWINRRWCCSLCSMPLGFFPPSL